MIGRLLLHPYVLLTLGAAVLTAGGIGWWHYRGLVSDLESAQTRVVTLTVERDAAVDLANRNAEMAVRADAQRRRTVMELEAAQERLAAAQRRDADAREEIARAPAEDDGPVAPLLERLRNQRFGGQ